MNKVIYELFRRNSIESPRKIAFADDTIEIDWERAFELVVSLGNEIKEHLSTEVSTTNRSQIVVKGDGCVLHVLLIFAIILNHFVYVPHNRTLARNKDHKFNQLPQIDVSNNTIVYGIKSWSIESFKNAKNVHAEELVANESPSAFYYTSGTTGSPKVIVNSDTNILRGAKFVSDALDLKKSDVIAGTLLLDFDYGVNQIFCTLFLGSTYISSPFSSTRIHWLKMIERYRPTIIPAMPFLIEKYFTHNNESVFDSVRMCTSSGAPLTKAHAKKINGLFPRATIVPMYGLSEGFRATIMPPGEYESRPSSVGKPIGDTEIRIVKNDFDDCAAMEIGEIIQSSGCTTWGYFEDPVSTRRKFVSDSNFPNRLWIKTGDLGYLDEDGYLYIQGRVESQIKLFGIRISIDEIESKYKEIPGVVNSVVIPISVNETESSFAVAVVSDRSLEEIKESALTLPIEYRTPNIRKIPEILGNYNGGKPDRTRIFERYFCD